MVTAVRWGTTAAALLLLSTGTRTRADATAGAAVLAYALWRTVQPVGVTRGTGATVLGVASEAAVMVAAVVVTGYWDSPYVLGIVTVVSLAGFSGGIQLSIPTAVVCIAAVALPYHLTDGMARDRLTVQWAGEFLLVAMVTGYARRLTLRASVETSAFLGRLRQLSEANTLLLELHRVATTLPVSLDLGETLDSSVHRLRELFEPEAMVILLREDPTGWAVARSFGVQMGARVADKDLPSVLRETSTAPLPRIVPLESAGISGLALGSESGIYAPLRARNELVGMVAVERRAGLLFTAKDLALMEPFALQLAVAIDNARWFARIGTIAAEEERNRIARDLHDRVGQSLALVGFELDRAAKSPTEEQLRRQVGDLRATVRSVVGELRETLFDLRTGVSEEHDVGAALADFLDRVGRRTKMEVSFQQRASRRLPLPVEREIWHIAQEAITNAERHALARTLSVVWTSGDDGALLIVTDDGEGMSVGARQSDRYGLVGMQERADAIGASLSITSSPGTGTQIRLSLAR